MEGLPLERRLLPGDRRQEDGARLRLHAPEEAAPVSARAPGCAPGRGSASVGADRQRQRAATCTWRSGRAPGWYEGGHFLRAITRHLKTVGPLELGAPPRRALAALAKLARLGLVPAAAGLIAVGRTGAAGGEARSSARPPKPAETRCLERCAGRQAAAVGATVRITGRRLGRVTEVGLPERVRAGSRGRRRPTGRHRVLVRVPSGAAPGGLVWWTPMAARAPRPGLRIVSTARAAGAGQLRRDRLEGAAAEAFFDAKRGVRLRYRFRSYGALDVTVKLVRRGSVVRAWTQKSRLPYASHRLTWNGMRRARRCGASRPVPVQAQGPGQPRSPHPEVPPGRRQVPGSRAARLRRRGAEVRGSAQRRSRPPGPGPVRDLRHPVVAARGGRVQSRGSDPVAVRELGGDRRSRHLAPTIGMPISPPGLGPRRRAGQDRRADRPRWQDRQRPHCRLHAALRGLALRLAPRRPRRPAGAPAPLGRLVLGLADPPGWPKGVRWIPARSGSAAWVQAALPEGAPSRKARRPLVPPFSTGPHKDS